MMRLNIQQKSANLPDVTYCLRRPLVAGSLGRRVMSLAALCLTLTACQSVRPEPRVEIQRVLVPTPIACVPEALGGPPVYPDETEALRSAPDGATRYQLMAAGRELRRQRLNEVEPVIRACQRTDAPSDSRRR